MSNIEPRIEDGVPYGTRLCPSWQSRNETRKDSFGHSGKFYCAPLCEVTGGCCGWICLPYVRQREQQLAAAQAKIEKLLDLSRDVKVAIHSAWGMLNTSRYPLTAIQCRFFDEANTAANVLLEAAEAAKETDHE